MVHNEKLCHDTGGRRYHYLKQIKCILGKLDTMPCPIIEPANPDMKPLNEYEAYQVKTGMKGGGIDSPLITSVPIKEIRRTSHLAEHLHENCRNMQYVTVDFLGSTHAPMDQKGRLKSFELKGGYVINNCSCNRRDGLQDQCELQGCQNKALCMAEPSPLCGPANVTSTGAQLEEALKYNPPPPPKPCCCDIGWPKSQMPEQFQCYPCSDGRH